jgi:predicted P-loop ATPase
MQSSIDIAQVAREALAAADRLVPDWLPDGRRSGHEWQARNPLRSDRSIGSFSVNLTTGAWADFASGDKGGDLVSLYAYLHGMKQGDAAREVARSIGMTPAASLSSSAPTPAPAPRLAYATDWRPLLPVPAHAPPAPVAHIKRGRPQATWTYRGRAGELLGHVYRFTTSDGGKEILPVVWARHERTGEEQWRWMQWTQPRPLYGLDRLLDDRPVLLVEGEKCADAAHQMLGEQWCVLTWPGGGKAVAKADWQPLARRSVLIWPDCDAQRDSGGALLPEPRQPGIAAAEAIAARLIELGAKVGIVRIPAPGAKAAGWDVADAIAEGMTLEAVQALLADRRLPVAAPPAPTPAAPADDWTARLLWKRGECSPCLSNVVAILANHEAWDGVIAFDEFAYRTIKRKPIPGARSADVGEWRDADTTAVRIWLTEQYGMVVGPQDVDSAVDLVAQMHAFHPVREYLDGLRWDGVSRLDLWLDDYLGVARSEYTTRVARWFLIAMVARVYDPGVKFDYCLVLEGGQGLRKSSALRILAGEFFSDTELDLTNKDAMSSIRGKWLHEFAEMGSLARAENTRQKSFLSRQIDEFRPTYARREIRCPRQLVFAGTTNDWQWNKDPTGGRRFWPIEIGAEIDTDALRANRDQLFAEAVQAYRAGERYWPQADEQRVIFDPQQLQREAEDGLFDMLHDWIEDLPRAEFTMGEVLAEALKLDAGRITRDVTTRVGQLLKKLGCGRKEKRNGTVRFVYVAPAWSKYQQAAQASRTTGGGDRDGLPV